MSETMKVALTFTAVDAASGYIAGLERRIDSLGEAGHRLRGEYDQMQSHFAAGLKGFGAAFASMQFMKPGIEAAAMLEASGLSVQNSLAASGKSAAAMAAEFKSLRSTALYLSAHSPFAAPDIMRAEKLLLDSGFQPGEIAGQNGLGAQVAGMSQLSGQSMEAVREMTEIFSQQFGGGAGGIGAAFDWISQSGMEDKLPELASGLASMGTMAAGMKIPVKDAVSTIGMLEHATRRSGAAIGAFLAATRPNATSHQAVTMRDQGLNFYNAKGNFIGMEATQKLLKQKFGGIQGDRLPILKNIFGDQGALAAEGLMKADNLADINAQNERHLKLMEKVKNLNDGLTASYTEMVHAMKNAGGSVFAPVTSGLAAIVGGGRDMFSRMSQYSEDHPGLSTGLAMIGGGVLAGGAAYGVLNWGKALGNLTAIVTGLKGTAGGIIAGKAAEMAGVTPVFITNWAGMSSTSAAGAVLNGTGGAIAATTLAKAIPSMLPFLWQGAAIAGAGFIGWEIGKQFNELFQSFADLVNFHPVDKLGDKMSAWTERRYADWGKRQAEEKKSERNKVIINMSIDKGGQLVAAGDLHTDFEINTSRGSFHGK